MRGTFVIRCGGGLYKWRSVSRGVAEVEIEMGKGDETEMRECKRLGIARV